MATAPSSLNQSSLSSHGGNASNVALSSLITLFFMMGFITCLNDILIPYMKAIFVLNFTQANLINLCFFGAYFFMAIPSGKIVEKLGYKPSMIIGFLVTALGAFLFYPAAEMRVYGLFLGALFILATGITLLQVSGNPYVAVLGKPETAPARLTLVQAFNSLGTTIAPVLGTAFILSKLPAITPETDVSKIPVNAVQNPYLLIGGVLIVIAIVLAAIKLPKIVHGGADDTNAAEVDKGSALGYKHLVFGVIGIFAYVGAEVAIGSHIVNYLEMPSVMGMAASEAGNYIAFYWGSAMVGRFIGSVSLKSEEYSKGRIAGLTALYSFLGYALINFILVLSGKFETSQAINYTLIFTAITIVISYLSTFVLKLANPGKILAYNALLSVLLILISILATGSVSMITILLIGFLNSIMFPTIFTLAVAKLGKYTDSASGLLSTAIVGGAIIPLAYGAITDISNLKYALILPAICYLYIAWYGVKGHIEAKSK